MYLTQRSALCHKRPTNAAIKHSALIVTQRISQRPNVSSSRRSAYKNTGVPGRHGTASRLQPGVTEAVGGRRTLLGVEVQHRQEKVGEGVGLDFRPLVLLHEDLVQSPRLQLGDVTQLP